MKTTLLIIFIALTSVCFLTCKKSPISKPVNHLAPISDTNTTLIANQIMVGNWTLVTDSVHVDVIDIDTVYHGTANDHYVFTKYGNMYIHSGFNRYIDSAIYTVSPENRIDWVNSYFSLLGAVIKGTSYDGYFSITEISAHSASLYQSRLNQYGLRNEVVKLKK